MMEDILRTVSQFTGTLKNVNIFMVESSENLAKQQQERLLDLIQKKLNVFLSYDLKAKEEGRDRFFNKDQGFSIGWYPNVKSVYNDVMQK